ncbi:MAG: hypothetical protein IID30_10830 [Planctomycetes bacterium]|nr:hypothetical protein [Planctomycetota bacterium]
MAEKNALNRHANNITPEDILVALAQCDRGVGRSILENVGIDLVQITDQITQLAPHVATDSQWVALGFDSVALHALAWAKEEARALNHNYHGTEHLVLGLLRDKDSPASSFLRKNGASLENVRDALVKSFNP